jgi:hypothetical protein
MFDKKLKVRTDLLSYWPMRAEFAVHDGLLLKGTSLVIQAVLQRDILSRLHEAHQGIVKCRERARNAVWWLGINKQLVRGGFPLVYYSTRENFP